jgi:uncharacterized RDD family membrane protein YckC
MLSTKCPQCGNDIPLNSKSCRSCEPQIYTPPPVEKIEDRSSTVTFERIDNATDFDPESGPSYSSYQPINTGIEDRPELASRVTRLLAHLIDNICLAPLLIIFGVTIAAGGDATIGLIGIGLLIAVFAIIQIYWLSALGQTIGKKVMKIRIAKLTTGENGGFITNVLIRIGAIFIISCVPFVGSFFALVNILFIFRDDKRCIHDLIAGTVVVKDRDLSVA